MAMTPPDGGSAPDPMPTAEQDLEIATQALRDHTDERWVEVSDNILAKVLVASRPSHPVRGRAGTEPFHVSERVLTAHVLDTVDQIPHIEAAAIRIHTGQDRYTGITIVITAEHGLRLIPAADAIREAARDRLTQVLGQLVPPISVSTMHVHVDDVTTGDPSLS